MGLALIVLAAVAFAAGMRWNEYAGTGKSAHSGGPNTDAACPMGVCPMMGMNHTAKPTPAKAAGETVPTGGDGMGPGCCSMAGEGTKQTDAPPPRCCSAMGQKPAAPADPAMKKP